MAENVEVDIRGAVAKLKKAGINVHVAVPKLVNRLMMQGIAINLAIMHRLWLVLNMQAM